MGKCLDKKIPKREKPSAGEQRSADLLRQVNTQVLAEHTMITGDIEGFAPDTANTTLEDRASKRTTVSSRVDK